MKLKIVFSFLLVIFITQNGKSQNFLVPINKDGKYGLISNDGQIVIEPNYENIEYIMKDYFEATTKTIYSEKIVFNDKEQDFNGKLFLKSLLKKNKIIIKDGSFDGFIVKHNYIIGINNFRNTNLTYNQRKKFDKLKSYSVLYNIQGIEVGLGEVLEIDEFFTSDKYSIFRIRKFDKTYDLILYDWKNNKISKKIISNSESYFFVNTNNKNGKKNLEIKYEDNNKVYNYNINSDEIVKNSILTEIDIAEITAIPKKEKIKEVKSEKQDNLKSINNNVNLYNLENNKISINPDTNNFFYYKIKPKTILINKKFGLFNPNDTEIVSANYDNIAYSGMISLIKNNFYYNKLDDYFVLEKDNHYGILELTYDDKTNNFKINYLLKPILKNYPLYYYDNYFDIPNLKIFKVIDDEGILLNYCDEKGKCY